MTYRWVDLNTKIADRDLLWLVKRKLRDAKYYIKNRVKTKHHIVRLRKFKPGSWHDHDGRLFEACFEVLRDYVENDIGLENLNAECKLGIDEPESEWIDSLKIQAENARKVQGLYNWYMHQHVDCWDAENTDRCQSEEDEKLHELINVRLSMWT